MVEEERISSFSMKLNQVITFNNLCIATYLIRFSWPDSMFILQRCNNSWATFFGGFGNDNQTQHFSNSVICIYIERIRNTGELYPIKLIDLIYKFIVIYKTTLFIWNLQSMTCWSCLTLAEPSSYFFKLISPKLVAIFLRTKNWTNKRMPLC